ncbi:flagellar basal body L-ring protein FlgH [Rhodothermus marinus]|uniref:flagellar basal body L-ring protein FlgH n=1 Tax=Rhodothermus marinus TaxID=29549 RepID=UPI0012BA49D9|nr:flagellar basal body L-ring protein FlgH [Rhodothermus marinus]BBM70548.1 hypothetical protein RmaAA213_23940 [Rhodothermus marinus]
MRALLLALSFLLPGLSAVAQSSLYADFRAVRPGDVITIILAERTAAQRESNFEHLANAKIGGAGAVSGTLGGKFSADVTFSRESKANNETLQRDLLEGTVTALVVGIDSTTGNLLIRGERKLNINGVTHLMRISGTVRPYDVRYDNTVFSYQIANAHIEYRQSGLPRKFFRPGFLTRLGALALIGAAIALGVQ